MSTKKNRKPRKGETRKPDKHAKYKLALIPVLLCVLAYVLFSGSSDDAESTADIASASVAAPSLASSPAGSEADATKPSVKQRSWPEVDLAFLDKPNPFSSYLEPEPAPQPAPELLVSTEAAVETPTQEDISQKLQQALAEQPIQYVFQSGSRKLVMLGEQLFEAGDAVFDGMRIEDVRAGRLEFTFTGYPADHAEPAKSVQ